MKFSPLFLGHNFIHLGCFGRDIATYLFYHTIITYVATYAFINCTLSAAAPITAPTITETTPLSSTSFTVSWTIADPDHNYIVTWTNRCTGVMNSTTFAENTSSHMVTGLNDVSNYIVSVTANNSCGRMMSEPVAVYG